MRPDERAPRPPASLAVKLRIALAVTLGAINPFRRRGGDVPGGRADVVSGAALLCRGHGPELFACGAMAVRSADRGTSGQTVSEPADGFIANHTSTVDMFVIIALGLPNCRYFLSGFLKKFLRYG